MKLEFGSENRSLVTGKYGGSFLWVLRLINKRICKQTEKEVAGPLEFVRKTTRQVSYESW